MEGDGGTVTVLWTQFSRGDQTSMSPLDLPTARSSESGIGCAESEESENANADILGGWYSTKRHWANSQQLG
jgi:hypothetical protein